MVNHCFHNSYSIDDGLVKKEKMGDLAVGNHHKFNQEEIEGKEKEETNKEDCSGKIVRRVEIMNKWWIMK